LQKELKEALKNDLWNIINKEKILKINFKKGVVDQLLGCKTFNLLIVSSFATRIEQEYKYALSYFYDNLEKGMYFDIIEPIKKTLSLFCKKVEVILRGLKNYREICKKYK